MAQEVLTKPRIGVPYRTKKEQLAGDRAQLQRYLKAVQMGGGEPIAIPLDLSHADLNSLTETLDGVVLSGSPADVAPALFGAAAHQKTNAPDRDRERTDFGLLENCFAQQKPILAICYGIQSLNVFLGGTLLQDIPSEIGTSIEHDVYDDYGTPETFHDVEVERGSRLWTLINGHQSIQVNSSHHQCVLRLGRGLQVAARANDGVIESVELPSDRHWVVAVQWHPERMVETDALALSLFRALTAAARKTPARSL
jgi:putative glutamine amidotransferase